MLWQFELFKERAKYYVETAQVHRNKPQWTEPNVEHNDLRVKSPMQAPRPRPPGYWNPYSR